VQANLKIVYVVLITIQVLFGVNFASSKVVVEVLDPVIWSNIRFFIAGIAMLFITMLLKRPHPKLNREFLLPIIPLSLFGMALGQGLFLYGLKFTTSVNTAVITTCIPILTLLLVVLRKQEKLTLLRGSGLIVAFAGVIFIRDIENFQLSSNTFIGDLMVFLGAFCFAIYLSFGKKFLLSFDNLWVTTWMFLVSGVIMTIWNIPKWLEFSLPQLSSTVWIAATYTIIGATLLTYFLNNWALKRAPSGNVALFIYLQPVVAAIIGWYYLDEKITLRLLVSSLCILGGLALSILPIHKWIRKSL
jgi:drug/metabolite transporter (DMT)-like permease